MLKAANTNTGDTQRVPVARVGNAEMQRALNDLLWIYNSDCYINEKGYLQKLVELSYKFGYYRTNKTLFR